MDISVMMPFLPFRSSSPGPLCGDLGEFAPPIPLDKLGAEVSSRSPSRKEGALLPVQRGCLIPTSPLEQSKWIPKFILYQF